MNKVKIGDKYIVPSGTELWFINLQQSLITTKDYVIIVTHICVPNVGVIFGDLYDVLFTAMIPGLMKIHHGETALNLSSVKPIGDLLEPKIFNYEITYER